MILCKDCIYWKRHWEGVNKSLFGECNSSAFNNNEYEDHELEDTSLVYWGHTSQTAYFETGQYFGCIHGEN